MYRTGMSALVAACVISFLTASEGAAQEGRRAVTLLAGASQYDLSGTGTAPVGALRVDLPLARRIVVEPGIAYLPYETRGGARVHHLLPEIQVQVQHPGERVLPYLGAGVGASWAIRPGEDLVDATLAGAAGVRVLTDGRWALRGELRVRTIDPWTGTTADWALGIGRTF